MCDMTAGKFKKWTVCNICSAWNSLHLVEMTCFNTQSCIAYHPVFRQLCWVYFAMFIGSFYFGIADMRSWLYLWHPLKERKRSHKHIMSSGLLRRKKSCRWWNGSCVIVPIHLCISLSGCPTIPLFLCNCLTFPPSLYNCLTATLSLCACPSVSV